MSNIIKGLNEGRSYGRDSWDSNMPGYQGDYGGVANWGRRNREDDEHHEIDAVLAARHAQRQEYERNGKFWLKLKDSQRHLPAGPFTGKQAANTAAVELLKQQPELKGNLLITAYGPDETQGVAEGMLGLSSKEKAKIQYVTSKISDIPGNWDHKNQQYTERGLADLKSVMKNEKYLKYALSLTSDDFEAEGVAEATGNPGMPHDFTAVQPGVEVWYKGRFAGWTTGKVYDDPYGKSGKMVAFDPNPSEFSGDKGRVLSLPYDEVSLRKSTSIGKLKGPEQGVAEGILGDREYNRVMPFVKRIAGEVNDYERDEFGEELWSLLDQKYGSKFAQSVLQDALDFYWNEYTALTGPGLDEASVYKKDQDLSSVSTQELEAFVKKHWGGGIPTWGQGESVKRAIRELRRRQKKGVAEGKEELHTQLQSINQKLKLMRGGPVGEPNSMAFVEKRKELLKQKEQILSQLKQGVAEGQLDELSNKTLASYKKKAGADATQADNRGDYARGNKRMSGIVKATKKEFDNDAKGVAEGLEQVYRVLAVDKSNALSKQVKLKVKASSLDEVFERLAINDWYPLEINGVEVINGKRLKQDVAEGAAFDKWADDRAASQLYKLKPATEWTVSYDYGPHMSKTVTVKARSEDEARDKVEKAAEKKGMSIMINSAEQGVAEEKQRLDPSCWKGYKKQGTKMKGDTRVNNCVPVKESAIMKGLK